MAERALSADVLRLILLGTIKPVIFVYANFPSGAQRVWSGIGDVVFMSETWIGIGSAMGIQQVAETTDTAAKGITVTINGLDAAFVNAMLNDNYQGQDAIIYLCFRDPDTGVLYPLNDPLWQGSLDTDQFEADGDTRTLTMNCEHQMGDILRARQYNYSYADQLLLYPPDSGTPVDTGMNKMEAIQDVVIPWGRTTTS